MEMKIVWQSLRMLVWMIILTGLIYPAFITFTAYFIFHDQAMGTLLLIDGKPRGSKLIAQDFHSDRYFWPRPSAVNFNPLSSGGSNLGPTSSLLKQHVEERRQTLFSSTTPNGRPDPLSIPPDLLFASGSGLDPHISPETCYYQLERIAKARSIKSQKLREWIDAFN